MRPFYPIAYKNNSIIAIANPKIIPQNTLRIKTGIAYFDFTLKLKWRLNQLVLFFILKAPDEAKLPLKPYELQL